MKPTIIIDDKIPFIKGVFDELANVKYINGTKISANDVRNADALIIRTRTHCDESLLKGSSVKCIATATIGFDHIDKDYCKKNNIAWSNVPGCNASSVEQYIAAALMYLQKEKNVDVQSKTIGIVGVGSVGKREEKFCKTIGMKVLLNDPPRKRIEKEKIFVSLNEIAEKCDIITFHTPLYMTGEDKTFHLADEAFFSKLKKRPYIFNAARGEVTDTLAMKSAKKNNVISGLVIDCWENEPNIDAELLKMTDISTAHIAGYSADGKGNATIASVQYISRFFHLGIDNWTIKNIPLPENRIIQIDSADEKEILSTAILATYHIQKDDFDLKNHPYDFELVRGNYPLRREFSSYFVSCKNANAQTINILKNLGFQIKD